MHHIIYDNDGGNDENVDPNNIVSMGAPILNLILGLVLFAALYDFFVTHHGIAYLAHP